MYTSLAFSNFRSIDLLKIENLSTINLFFGKNNCGKTTVLESIFLLSGMNNPDLFRRCNIFRSYKHIKDFRFFFHNLNTNNTIVLKSSGDTSIYNRKSEISFSEELVKKVISEKENSNTTLNTFSTAEALNIKTTLAKTERFDTKITLSTIKNQESALLKIPAKYKEQISCTYLPPNISFETIPPMVKEVLQDKKETVVIDALKQIDDRIKDFVLFEDEVMVDVGLEKRIPINILGDGVRKFFTLILAIYRSKNGILLIDEIDNGLHFSTMEKLWRILLNVATIFNVQLFITTHNIDSLKGLKNVLASDNSLKNLVSAYKILRKEKIHETLYYNADSFSTVIQQENEIR